MTTPPSEANRKLDEIPLAVRLGRESRERIAERMRRGIPFLASVKIEADYIADAWAHYDFEVQIPAIHVAFDGLHHRYPHQQKSCSILEFIRNRAALVVGA